VDAAALAIEGRGDTEAMEQALEQSEIALCGFCGEELGGQDFAGGIVLHAQSDEAGATVFEPVMRAAVKLDEFAFASDARAALTMSRRAAFARPAEIFLAQKAAQSLTSKGEAFDFTEFLAEMVVVEARIFRARQAQNGLAGALRQPTAAGLAAVGVS